MFTGIARLLKFLKKSFQIQSSRNKISSPNNQDEQQFQTAVINGIGTENFQKEIKSNLFFVGDFAEKLPDFQMMEIMQFIITSLPTLNQGYDEKSKDSKFVCFCFFI